MLTGGCAKTGGPFEGSRTPSRVVARSTGGGDSGKTIHYRASTREGITKNLDFNTPPPTTTTTTRSPNVDAHNKYGWAAGWGENKGGVDLESALNGSWLMWNYEYRFDCMLFPHSNWTLLGLKLHCKYLFGVMNYFFPTWTNENNETF